MFRVLARCPVTKEAAPTNLVMDEAAFRFIRLGGITYRCAVCQRFHEIDQHEAWVAQTPVDGAGPS